ncbi:MAG: WYL domain-containing protein [Bacteroidales bacterium]|nr:WYL domain-containing protein [Bacteroidales bacterium]
MATPTQFREYIWLVNTIQRAGGITFAELSNKWADSELGGMALSRTTFNRHRDAILDIFGIIIDCNRRNGNKYFIFNSEVLQEDTVQNWMLSTLSVHNIVSESLSLSNRILLENIPSGGTNLQTVIQAMKKGHKISAKHLRYGAENPKEFVMLPYCVKLYRQRWYALCMLRHGNMGVFSLDRFADVSISDEKFTVVDGFDAAEYFSECFGIVSEVNAPAERIVIRAFGNERYFMRDLPVHHTQREINFTDEYTDYEIVMRPTFDFSGYMLSRGVMAKIIEPQWLADEIHDMHLQAVEMYEK